jgi:hypothetical protein
MVHGRTAVELRPRTATARWSVLVIVVCAFAAAATHSWTPLVFAWVPVGLLAQSRQRLEVDGRYVRRSGPRPVEVDLATASVQRAGRAWWAELFFLGHHFEVCDADGHVLRLESWLWGDDVRNALVERIGGSTRS